MTLDKLKVAARQQEQKENWRAAIDLYREAIRSTEGELGGADPGLFNRIGDLEQKAGDHSAASDAWEQAAARYGEHGFFNNAIAVCGKILRLDPGQVRIYLELARYQARKRVLYDVKLNLTTYRDRLTEEGQADQASDALLEFEKQFDSWAELRSVVDELLGRESAGSDQGSDGNNGGGKGRGLVFLDTEAEGAVDPEAMEDSDGLLTIERAGESTGGEVTQDQGSELGLIIEPTTVLDQDDFSSGDGGQLAGLETTAVVADDQGDDQPVDSEAGDVPGIVDFERTAIQVGDPDAVDGFEETAVESSADTDSVEAITLDGLESSTIEVPEIESTPELSIDVEPNPEASPSDLIFLDTDKASPKPSAKSPPAVEPPANSVQEVEDDDPLVTRAEGHERLDEGDRQGAVAKLEEALAGYQSSEEWAKAWQVATELVEAEPRAIGPHQVRVELAARLHDPAKLTGSYFDLGEALMAEGSEEKAIAVFRRLLEIDDSHAGARGALRKMVPDAPEESDEDGFVDFGAMVIDDVGPRSTRMRTETTNISEDEDETFKEALEEFKRALDQNLPVEDYQTHYDLGLAFKEMGLLDEAITALQKALRSPEGRLRTSEALGQCFYDQGRPAVAEAVLRAVERGEEGDAEKIGVLYWLGRALEAQKKNNHALSYYERVLAVDVGFQDASERATELSK